MKVMCTEDKPMFKPPRVPWKIKKNREYGVLQARSNRWGIYYELDIHPGVMYASEHFSILPEQSADEINEQEHEAIIYQR